MKATRALKELDIPEEELLNPQGYNDWAEQPFANSPENDDTENPLHEDLENLVTPQPQEGQSVGNGPDSPTSAAEVDKANNDPNVKLDTQKQGADVEEVDEKAPETNPEVEVDAQRQNTDGVDGQGKKPSPKPKPWLKPASKVATTEHNNDQPELSQEEKAVETEATEEQTGLFSAVTNWWNGGSKEEVKDESPGTKGETPDAGGNTGTGSPRSSADFDKAVDTNVEVDSQSKSSNTPMGKFATNEHGNEVVSSPPPTPPATGSPGRGQTDQNGPGGGKGM